MPRVLAHIAVSCLAVLALSAGGLRAGSCCHGGEPTSAAVAPVVPLATAPAPLAPGCHHGCEGACFCGCRRTAPTPVAPAPTPRLELERPLARACQAPLSEQTEAAPARPRAACAPPGRARPGRRAAILRAARLIPFRA